MMPLQYNNPLMDLTYGQSPKDGFSGLFASSAGHQGVLYIFPPRFTGVQLKRPFVYNIDDTMINTLADSLAPKVMRTTNGVYDIAPPQPATIEAIVSSDAVASSLIPAVGANSTYTANMTSFDHLYSFTLIIDNERPNILNDASISKMGFDLSNFGQVSNHLRNNRVVYYGYFMNGEPCARAHNAVGYTINENAILTITHKTIMNDTTAYMPSGAVRRREVVADGDIVHPIVANLSNNPLHYNTPDVLLSNSEKSIDGTFSTLIGSMTEIYPVGQTPKVIPNSVATPVSNMRHILQTAASSCQMLASGQYDPLSMATLGDVDPGDFTSQFASNQLKPVIGQLVDIGINVIKDSNISIKRLTSLYPSIAVMPVIFDVGQTGLCNQADESLINIFSCLFCQVAPVICSNYGITHLVFTYDSTMDDYNYRHITNGLDYHSSAFLISNITVEEQKQRIINALSTIKSQLFRPMKQTGENFRISAAIAMGSVTRCLLNFYGYNEINQLRYETPTIAGGFMSPLVGNQNTTIHNAQSLALMMDRLIDFNAHDAESRCEYLGATPSNHEVSQGGVLSAAMHNQTFQHTNYQPNTSQNFPYGIPTTATLFP